ncbi:MAG TPA: EAL domain-containing protein [Nitrosomonas sp.]|uniref:bifunctional diguanylate cyclase/phosphodiesterase n=1 Tax=Nitrosomonas sp. TaxID=42353 RepID=UPI002087F64A|nr:EAL domain-containing protein [Nitrosomonas sp.]GJL74111.1 MAG: GGDEF domain-containing protein [Nitrosomonas sp.]HNP26636.1 EAL domain-containing protein [Nitrosomonas sp.]
MISRTLNHSIFKLVGGLLCFTTCAILIAVWIATTNHARIQATQGLDIGQSIFTQVLSTRENQLYNSAFVLTADYGFIQSVASKDKATITSVLHNHGGRISADLMALLSLDGNIISSTSVSIDSKNPFLTKELIKAAIVDGGATTILEIDKTLYQVILLTVDAPVPIAIAAIGFEINQALIEELAAITKLHITIESRYASGEKIAISSLPDTQLDNVNKSVAQEISILRSPFERANRFFSKQFLLSELKDRQVWIILSEDLNSLFAEFNLLQVEITFITILSIGLALLLGALFAKNLSRPLTNLSAMAQRIARGDYQESIDTQANLLEINNLAIAFSVMQENVRHREKKIQFQASHDLLTNLYNRYQITEIIQQKMSEKKPFQVFGMNIQGFREINDTFGYYIGDRCLQLLADRFLELEGHTARLNGGELLWLPEKIVEETTALEIRKRLEQPLKIDNTVINVRFAIGVVRYPVDTEDAQALFRHISIAVDHARQQENLYQAYNRVLENSYLYRLEVLNELKQTLSTSQSELAIYYQPKLNLHTRQVNKVEALIRWNSKRLGFISPELFIPIAEQAGFINQVTDWVIDRVIQDTCRWQRMGINLQVAINLSVHDVANANLLPGIVRRLEQAGLENNLLAFEITESDLMKKPEKAIEQLQAFRAHGFSLAIDDFGTGYSSLAYLKNMPVSELKLDKSFILKLDQQTDDQSIVQTIITLARTFNLETVAEGVENEAALRLLDHWGCDWIQGYFISKPMANDQIQHWLMAHNTANWINTETEKERYRQYA